MKSLWLSGYPIGQEAGNPCRGRFNTERMATWPSGKAAKKTTSAFIERHVWSPRLNKYRNNAKWFWNTRWSYFSSNVSRNSWKIQLRKVQTVWMAEKNFSRILILKNDTCSGRVAQWSEASHFAQEEVEVQVQILTLLVPVFCLFFHRIFTLWLASVYSHRWPFLASQGFGKKWIFHSLR